MLVSLKGNVLEKFIKPGKTREGSEIDKCYIRLYQKGQRQNLDINVDLATYTQCVEGDDVILDDVSLNVWKDNIYAKM